MPSLELLLQVVPRVQKRRLWYAGPTHSQVSRELVSNCHEVDELRHEPDQAVANDPIVRVVALE